jgi:hypothetical protein
LPRLVYVTASTRAAAATAATVNATIVLMILRQNKPADPLALREPSLPQALPPVAELSAVATWSEPSGGIDPIVFNPTASASRVPGRLR